MTYDNTIPKPGDSENNLLGKILQRLNGIAQPGDSNHDLLVKILTQFAGSGSGGGGGAAQSPWTGNINGGGFALSNASSVDGVSSTELSYLIGATSAIQTQINSKQPLDATLTSWAAFNSNGIVVQTAPDTFTSRTLTAASTKIAIVNGDGVAGNPTVDVNQANLTLAESQITGLVADLAAKQASDATLTSLAAYNTNGLVTQTAADTFTGRTIIGTASRLTVTDGDGVAGNPTLDISAAYVGQTSITSIGTLTAGSTIADAQSFAWATRSKLSSSADGLITLFNNASTDFGRLHFGGITSSFPALKRSTTTLQFRLADDSAFASYTALSGTAQRDAIGATPTDGYTLTNTTAAAAGAQQYSPSLRLIGQGWKTTATAASQTCEWRIYNVPVQGAANPTHDLNFDSQINGAGFTTRMNLGQGGLLNLAGTLQVESSGAMRWNASTRLRAPSNGLMTLLNAAETDFTRLQFGGTTSSFPSLKRSATVLQARLADDSAFAPLQGQLRTDVNAVTGLTAGVLSATTNASIVVYDASGQAYRIPCII